MKEDANRAPAGVEISVGERPIDPPSATMRAHIALDADPVTSQRLRPLLPSEMESSFFRALAATSEAFIAVGLSGVVLYCSAGAKKLLAPLADQCVGQSLALVVPELEQLLAPFRDALRQGRIAAFDARVRDASGAPVELAVTAAPALSEFGEVVATVLALRERPSAALGREAPAIPSHFGHDLANIFATVETYTSFVASTNLAPRQTEDLHVARDAARRGAALVGQLLGSGASQQALGQSASVPISAAAERASAPLSSQGAGVITALVVEDDAAMRDGLRRILQGEGYRVLEAADGIEAEEIAARYPGAIQVLVSDLTLPRADGHVALARVRASRPDIGAVFVSGRLDLDRPLPEGALFVQKPFASAELTAAVARVIADASPSAGGLSSVSPVVVIVDDDDDLREAFARVIEECEFVAVRAKSGLHALKILGERHVDVVISDQFMPGIDGMRLLELVRDRFPHCVRILFTAYPSPEVVLEAINRCGVHKVLLKSMHAVAIRDEIERAVLSSAHYRAKP
jgi:CheY-like chemotaxis protein